ncbi:hypothetical protein [Hydrogenobaculum phage 1]|uniref:hypothetical protein n=1 Tax=Hydrogenobaculum phage 1 TaxID=1732176 RepID=UPI00070573EF|nr:hypothetical protein AUR69_gp19 [Hydrogenobaculum phage 1]ALG96930.1 hypothetical protein [Hydrogenobaculum phage 1]
MGKERTVEGRIGSNVDPILYRELRKIARMFGRTKSDLLKEAIWEIIQQKNQKKGGGAMQAKEFLIEQKEERINIIDLSNDFVKAYIVLDLTEDKNEMKRKLERAFEIAGASLMKYSERTYCVDGLCVKDKGRIEEIFIYDENNTEQKRIFINASKNRLDKAKEIAENILQLK